MNTLNRKNLFILSFTLLVVMLGYSLAMPLLPFYIERFGVGGTELGWLMSTYSLMQLICAPIWGIASDRYGRKPILAVGVLGYTLTLFMFGIAQSFLMMFIARSLSGILSSATIPALAYCAGRILIRHFTPLPHVSSITFFLPVGESMLPTAIDHSTTSPYRAKENQDRAPLGPEYLQ